MSYFNLSEPQFAHFKNGDINNLHPIGLMQVLNEETNAPCLAQCLARIGVPKCGFICFFGVWLLSFFQLSPLPFCSPFLVPQALDTMGAACGSFFSEASEWRESSVGSSEPRESYHAESRIHLKRDSEFTHESDLLVSDFI